MNMNKEQLIKDLKQLLSTLESNKKEKAYMPYGSATVIGNAGIPGCGHASKNQEFEEKLKQLRSESDKSKDYKYIVKNSTISPRAASTVELLSSNKGFLAKTLMMIVVNRATLENSIVEIANITVMGTPQLVGYNGCTDSSLRGSSLAFKEQQNWINFDIFGAYDGQGLTFYLVNPNDYEISVSIILGGLIVSSEMVGCK